MIESYKHEVQRKKRSARFFWFLVFIFASFLYFFFQGLYPDIPGTFRRIFSESGSLSQSGETNLIRSFGIINVKTTPSDATILLASGSYNQDEKRMVDYGKYTITLSKDGYIPNTMRFFIDSDKPFFIEDVTLIEKPSYQKSKNIITVYPVGMDEYLVQTGSGIFLGSGNTFTGTNLFSGSLNFLGNPYFSSGNTLFAWENHRLKRQSQEKENFIKTCKKIEIKNTLLSCPESQSIMTANGEYLTGITDIQDNLIIKNTAIYTVGSTEVKKIGTLSGSLEKTSIIDNIPYRIVFLSGAIEKDTKNKILKLPLDTIQHTKILGDDIIWIGSLEGKPYLIIKNIRDPENRFRILTLAEHLSYDTVEIRNMASNILIKTPKALFFIYRGSTHIEWIAEGDILAYSLSTVWYKKDDELWTAKWNIPEKL